MGSAAALSQLLSRLDPVLRAAADLGAWQVISPVAVAGVVRCVATLGEVQDAVYDEATILVAGHVSGEEEIPDGAVAVLTPDMPDVLSHVSVRARNGKVSACRATPRLPPSLPVRPVRRQLASGASMPPGSPCRPSSRPLLLTAPLPAARSALRPASTRACWRSCARWTAAPCGWSRPATTSSTRRLRPRSCSRAARGAARRTRSRPG